MLFKYLFIFKNYFNFAIDFDMHEERQALVLFLTGLIFSQENFCPVF